MADDPKVKGSVSPAPAPQVSPIAPLPKNASKEQLLQAIRHLMTHLQHKPTQAEVIRYLGEHVKELAAQYFHQPKHSFVDQAINAAHIKGVDILYKMQGKMRAGLSTLAQELGHPPTPFEIDNCTRIPPAYVYQTFGLLKAAPGKGGSADGYQASRPKTLAERSSFQPRVVPAFAPSRDFKGYRKLMDVAEAEEQARVQRIMAKPMPVPKGSFNDFVFSANDYDRPDPADTEEEVREQRVRQALLLKGKKKEKKTKVKKAKPEKPKPEKPKTQTPAALLVALQSAAPPTANTTIRRVPKPATVVEHPQVMPQPVVDAPAARAPVTRGPVCEAKSDVVVRDRVVSGGRRVVEVVSKPAPLPLPSLIVDDTALDGKHPIEAALIGKKLNDPSYARNQGLSGVSSADMAEYIGQNGSILVPRFWRIQSLGREGQKLGTEVLIYFYVSEEGKKSDVVSGIRIINANEVPPRGLPKDVTILRFRFSPRHQRYMLTAASGNISFVFVMRWLASQAVIPDNGLEMNFLARTFGTRVPAQATPWKDLELRIEREGGKLFERLWYTAHPGQPLPRRIAFVATQKGSQADGMRFESVSVIDKVDVSSAWLFLEYSDAVKTYVVKAAGGNAGHGLGFAWFRSHKIDTSRLSTRSFIVLLWNKVKKTALTLEKGDIPLITDLKADLAQPKYVPELLRARSLLEPGLNQNTSSVHAMSQCRGEKYSGLRIFTAEEPIDALRYKDYTKVKLIKGGSGHFSINSAVGRKGEQFTQSSVQLNDITQVAGTLVGDAWNTLDHRVRAITRGVARGGAIMFLGDKISDMVLHWKLPQVKLQEAVVDYGVLTAGSALGKAVATTVFNLSPRSLLGRFFPLFSAMSLSDARHTGKIHFEQFPLSAANVLSASYIVRGSSAALRKSLHLVAVGGKMTVIGAVLTTAAEMTLLKLFGDIESKIAEDDSFESITRHVGELLSRDARAIQFLSRGQSVPEDYFQKIDQELAEYEVDLAGRDSLPVRQVKEEYAEKLDTLREKYLAKMGRILDGTWSRSEVTTAYDTRRRTLEMRRDTEVDAARAQEDQRYTRLAVDPVQAADQLLDQVDEDALQADVDMDGNPGHPEKTLEYQSLLARNWQALSQQIAQYRHDRLEIIKRYRQEMPPKIELEQLAAND